MAGENIFLRVGFRNLAIVGRNNEKVMVAKQDVGAHTHTSPAAPKEKAISGDTLANVKQGLMD